MQSVYEKRRAIMRDALGSGVLVVPSWPTAMRSHDQHHVYRASSDLFYLTGFSEPESVLVLSAVHDVPFTMFVRPRDPERERWDGPRLGVDAAKTVLGADQAFSIHELDQRLPELLKGADTLFYRFGELPEFDARIFSMLGQLRARARSGIETPRHIVDASSIVHEARLTKSREEVECIRAAMRVTEAAHEAAMKVGRPGVNESSVEGALWQVFREAGGIPAYESIVASGSNATYLHYIRNDRLIADGDLVLIDAAVELAGYASDITRTFPANGRFSAAQRAVYDVVLSAQLAAIEAARPGATLDDVHHAALGVIVDGLRALKIVEGSRDEVLNEKKYMPYYMHRTSHWLGIDVHDVGAYYRDGKARALEPGFVFTVEPGIYIADDSAASAEFRGIGIRIEDDVLITSSGHDVLTHSLPKAPEAIERRIAELRAR